MIRSLIIDDEEDARESLRLLLNKHCPEIEVLRICDGPQEGLEAIRALQPDLLFLDVQMPGMTGFDLLRKLESPRFRTIFVTAHDQYAIQAIKFSALDYLLKPVDPEELGQAVKKASQKIDVSSYSSMLHNEQYRLGALGKLAVPVSDGMLFLDIEKIICAIAEGSYCRIHQSDGSSVLISRNLKELASVLDPTVYCRVHHSSLINLKEVARYIKGEGGYVMMSNGMNVDVSRRKKEEFMRLIARL